MIAIYKILQYLEELEIDFEFVGNKSDLVVGFSSLFNYQERTCTWIKRPDSHSLTWNTEIFLAIHNSNELKYQENIKNHIITPESKKAFFLIIEEFWGMDKDSFGQVVPIGKNTVIGKNVRIGKNVSIGHNCVIEGDIEICDNVLIHDNVVIKNKVEIGSYSEIHSGTIIGHDGFGWIENKDSTKRMIKHYGGVKIGEHVFIGPSCVIDRGTIDDTIIENGVKMDAQTFIAHNVCIGKDSILIVGTKLYGSVVIGKNVHIASSIVRNQCRVGDNSIIGMGSVVTKNIEDNAVFFGNPAKSKFL